MRAKISILIQDPEIAPSKELGSIIDVKEFEEEFFLTGPVSRRVAVVDFNAAGKLRRRTAYIPPKRGNVFGSYRVNTKNIYSNEFIQTSMLGTVLRTMALFENPQTLGRPIKWAFEAPQLLVVPRAGEWGNAFYERSSHSLQFFYIPNPLNPKKTIYTALSRDIVAHETGHAIIDGIARDLYHALSPQSVAMHEAIADMVALFMAFDSKTLTLAVLELNKGSIENSSAFSSIAEQIGRALDPTGHAGFLRSLLNNKSLDPADISLDELGRPNQVNTVEPHDLSEVLSGALYSLIVKIHKQKKDALVADTGNDDFSVSGQALAATSSQFKAVIFRGLDYLPPGEASFADLGRAMIAGEQILFPDESGWRDWIIDEFLKRKIVDDRAELEVATRIPFDGLKNLKISVLVESDWAAYSFANANRDFLRIPQSVKYFRVYPRLDVTKTFFASGGEMSTLRECLFKVTWDEIEENPPDMVPIYSEHRQMTKGTTLVINWDTGEVLTLLTSDSHPRQKSDRDDMLRWLYERGVVKIGDEAYGPDGKPLNGVVRAEVMDGLMRIRETNRTLHIARASRG